MQRNLLHENADWICDDSLPKVSPEKFKSNKRVYCKFGDDHWSNLIERNPETLLNIHKVGESTTTCYANDISNDFQPLLVSSPFVVRKMSYFTHKEKFQPPPQVSCISFNASDEQRKEPMGGESDEIVANFNKYMNMQNGIASKLNRNVPQLSTNQNVDQDVQAADGYFKDCFSSRPPTVGQSEDIESVVSGNVYASSSTGEDVATITNAVSSFHLWKNGALDDNYNHVCLHSESGGCGSNSSGSTNSVPAVINGCPATISSSGTADKQDSSGASSKDSSDMAVFGRAISSAGLDAQKMHLYQNTLNQEKASKSVKHSSVSAIVKAGKCSPLESDADDASLQTECQSDYRGSTPTSVSSLASSKKLEWDNGADIGYGPHSKIPVTASRPYSAPILNIALQRTEPEGISVARKMLLPFSRRQLMKANSSIDKDTQTSETIATNYSTDTTNDETEPEEEKDRLTLASSSASSARICCIHSASDGRSSVLTDVCVQTEILSMKKDAEIQVNSTQMDTSPHSSLWSVSTGSTVRPSSDGLQILGSGSGQNETSEDDVPEQIKQQQPSYIPESIYFKKEVLSRSAFNSLDNLVSDAAILEERKAQSLPHINDIIAQYGSKQFGQRPDINAYNCFIQPNTALENMHIHSMIPPYQMQIEMSSSRNMASGNMSSETDSSSTPPGDMSLENNGNGLKSQPLHQSPDSSLYPTISMMHAGDGFGMDGANFSSVIQMNHDTADSQIRQYHLLRQIGSNQFHEDSASEMNGARKGLKIDTEMKNNKTKNAALIRNGKMLLKTNKAKESIEHNKATSKEMTLSATQTSDDQEDHQCFDCAGLAFNSMTQIQPLKYESCLQKKEFSFGSSRSHLQKIPFLGQDGRNVQPVLPLLQGSNSELKGRIQTSAEPSFDANETRKDPLGAATCQAMLPQKKNTGASSKVNQTKLSKSGKHAKLDGPSTTSSSASSSSNVSVNNKQQHLSLAQNLLPSVTSHKLEENKTYWSQNSLVDSKGASGDVIIPPLVDKQKSEAAAAVQNSEAKIGIGGLKGVSFSLNPSKAKDGVKIRQPAYNGQLLNSGIYLTLSNSKNNCLFCIQEQEQKRNLAIIQDKSKSKSLCAEAKKKKKCTISSNSCLCSSSSPEDGSSGTTAHLSKKKMDKVFGGSDGNLSSQYETEALSPQEIHNCLKKDVQRFWTTSDSLQKASKLSDILSNGKRIAPISGSLSLLTSSAMHLQKDRESLSDHSLDVQYGGGKKDVLKSSESNKKYSPDGEKLPLKLHPNRELTSNGKKSVAEEAREDNNGNIFSNNNRAANGDGNKREKVQSHRKKQEVEKLRHLVERQKQNYRKRLKRELQRLEQLEEQILSELEQHIQNGPPPNRNPQQVKHHRQQGLPELPDANPTSSQVVEINSLPLNEQNSELKKVESLSTPLTASSTQDQSGNSSSEQSNTVLECHQAQEPVKTQAEKDENKENKDALMVVQKAAGSETGVVTLQDRETQTSLDNQHTSNNNDSSSKQASCDNKSAIEVQQAVTNSLPHPSPKRKNQLKAAKAKKTRSSTSRHNVDLTNPAQRNVAWFIPCVPPSSRKPKVFARDPMAIAAMPNMKSGSVIAAKDLPDCFTCKSLQEAFYKHCGHFIKRSQGRLQRISYLAEVRRSQTSQALRHAKLAAHAHAMPRNKLQSKLPPGLSERPPRTFSHKEMREQTERLYQMLPEVILYRENKKKEEQHKMNRLMAHLFKKRLQEQALKGRVSWTITQSCL